MEPPSFTCSMSGARALSHLRQCDLDPESLGRSRNGNPLRACRVVGGLAGVNETRKVVAEVRFRRSGGRPCKASATVTAEHGGRERGMAVCCTSGENLPIDDFEHLDHWVKGGRNSGKRRACSVDAREVASLRAVYHSTRMSAVMPTQS
jgi:hypothetical protein